jgi:hypothetical protein
MEEEAMQEASRLNPTAVTSLLSPVVLCLHTERGIQKKTGMGFGREVSRLVGVHTFVHFKRMVVHVKKKAPSIQKNTALSKHHHVF